MKKRVQLWIWWSLFILFISFMEQEAETDVMAAVFTVIQIKYLS